MMSILLQTVLPKNLPLKYQQGETLFYLVLQLKQTENKNTGIVSNNNNK